MSSGVQVGDRVVRLLLDRGHRSPSSGRGVGGRSVVEVASPAAAWMQVWMLMAGSSPGTAVVPHRCAGRGRLPSERQDAPVADAHPAAAGHQHAGCLGRVEDQGVAGSLDDVSLLVKVTVPPSPGRRSGAVRNCSVNSVSPALLVVRADGVEQGARAAGVRRPVAPRSGTRSVRCRGRARRARRRTARPAGSHRRCRGPRGRAEDRVGLGWAPRGGRRCRSWRCAPGGARRCRWTGRGCAACRSPG